MDKLETLESEILERKIQRLERKIKNLESIALQQGGQIKNIIEALQAENTFMKNQTNINEQITKAVHEAFVEINELSTKVSSLNNKKEKRSMYETRNH